MEAPFSLYWLQPVFRSWCENLILNRLPRCYTKVTLVKLKYYGSTSSPYFHLLHTKCGSTFSAPRVFRWWKDHKFLSISSFHTVVCFWSLMAFLLGVLWLWEEAHGHEQFPRLPCLPWGSALLVKSGLGKSLGIHYAGMRPVSSILPSSEMA